MDKHAYMDNIVSIPKQPPFNPAAMAVLTQAAQTIRQNAIVDLAHNQQKAIARMQEKLEPILRIQKQIRKRIHACSYCMGKIDAARR